MASIYRPHANVWLHSGAAAAPTMAERRTGSIYRPRANVWLRGTGPVPLALTGLCTLGGRAVPAPTLIAEAQCLMLGIGTAAAALSAAAPLSARSTARAAAKGAPSARAHLSALSARAGMIGTGRAAARFIAHLFGRNTV